MTWNELNDRTGDMMPDMLGQAWYDLVEDGGDEDYVYRCQALDMVIEVLEEFDPGDLDGFGRLTDNHAEYLENQMLLKELRTVR